MIFLPFGRLPEIGTFLVGIIIFVLVTLLGPAISKFISDLMASV